MSYYPIALTLHLFAALMFVGTVFFEVLILEGVRKRVSPRFMEAVESAVGNRAKTVMPWALLVLYGAGIAMVAMRYWPQLSHPLDSSFGTMLALKILLALSVFGHFCTAMYLRSRGNLKSIYFKRIHLSVFIHMVLIVILAKAMFFWTW
ncbi:MAG: hypothetical protein Q4G28_02020 [Neisseria sp.]|nr:hypothetical protein [Neisseria sp.]